MEFFKKGRLNIFIGILLTALTAYVMYLELSPLETLETKLFDYRMKLRGPIKPPDNIIIAALDEKSISKLGRWPWGREKIAELVGRMNDGGAEIIMFDILFSEDEKNDAALGKALKDAGNVILPVAFDFEKKSEQREEEPLLRSSFSSVTDQDMFRSCPPVSAKGILVPVAPLANEAMALGHVNMLADNDGTLRWETMVIEYNSRLYPSIDLQVAAAYLGIPLDRMTLQASNGIILGKKGYLFTNKWGQVLINYYGGENTFPQISIADIMDGTAGAGKLRGKIILVGATNAKGIFDLRVTPFSAELSGVEKHASVIAAIMENRQIRVVTPAVDRLILLFSGLVFSLMLSFLIERYKVAGSSIITVTSLFLFLLTAYQLFVQKGLWINVTYPGLNILLISISVTGYNFAVEERFARRIRAMFSSYVTERLVDELINNPDLAKLGGEKREITVLFSDVKGFTSFSERHEPEQVVAILNEYLGEMTSIVLKWEGTLDKFIGDAVMAFWNAPRHQENHAELAVKCALDMIRGLKELQQKWEMEGKACFDIGIGINTGEVIVGNIGAEGKKMDYTVIGDHVNLSSRVEALTRKYNTHILITEFTEKMVREAIKKDTIGHVAVSGLEKVIVKGKERSVGIYEIMSLDPGSRSSITDCDKDKVIRMKEK